ncbi:MAG: DEAD/DEAH box helicase [Parachlamydiaceae bacterium]|nr:DEAD/DEAH box helicase [Parachlamydiaceae bacterium]
MEKVQLESCIHKFMKSLSTQTYLKGSGYFNKKLVFDLNIVGDVITAQVMGSALKPYDVHIKPSKLGKSLGICSCPMKNDCKHVAATLLQALAFIKNPAAMPKKNPTTVAPNYNVNAKAPSIQSKEVPLPEIFKPTDEKVGSWLNEIGKDVPTSIVQSNVEKRQLLYILDYFDSTATLWLSLKWVKLKKDGGYLKTGQIVIDPRNLWSPTLVNFRNSITDEQIALFSKLMRVAGVIDHRGICLDFSGAGDFLKQLISTRNCYPSNDLGTPILWGLPQKGTFSWSLMPDGESQRLNIAVEESSAKIVKGIDPLCYYRKDFYLIGPIDLLEVGSFAKQLINAPTISNSEINEVHKILSAKIPALSKKLPVEIKETFIQRLPHPHVKLSVMEFRSYNRYWGSSKSFEILIAEVSFSYAGHNFPLFNGDAKNQKFHWEKLNIKGEIVKVERRIEEENRLLGHFDPLGWKKIEGQGKNIESTFMCGSQTDFEDYEIDDLAIDLLQHDVPTLKKFGWTVDIDRSFPFKEVQESDEWFLDAGEESDTPQNDWFDVKLGVMIDGERLDMMAALREFIKHSSDFSNVDDEGTIPLYTGDGRVIMVSAKRIRSLAEHLMLEFSKQASNQPLRVSKYNAAFLEEFASGEAAAKSRWIGCEGLKDFAQGIRASFTTESILPPVGLKCELRPYQLQGVNWMQFLRKSQLHGILADDMGLGKTVQALAHILLEKESGRLTSPALIVAPTSLMPNWQSEAARFTPDLKVLLLHGNERAMNFSKIKEFDLILTTYPLLMRDKEFLIIHQFHLLILDEAQTVKNFKTQAYQVLQQIKANQRLCLTGTPMENHLGELWSLFNLLLPGFLGDQKTFQTIFRRPIEKENDQTRLESLTKRIKPFILRRIKQQVALELPDKTEIIRKIELREKQRDLYEAIRIKAQEQLMREINKKGLGRSQIAVLDALLKLRQVCCDPRLVKIEKGISIEESAKLECLMEMLETMVEEGRKILVFSQFTSMLALISDDLAEKNIPYTILTGDTKDRATPVQKFQAGEVPIMLISLKAGGVGLNLTAADTVIHYDPWWNPAVESQATDRAHRIGQKNAVFVYKLVVSGSLEEKILDLQERKKNLIFSVLDANGKSSAPLSMEDLESIFQPLPSING